MTNNNQEIKHSGNENNEVGEGEGGSHVTRANLKGTFPNIFRMKTEKDIIYFTNNAIRLECALTTGKVGLTG